MNIEILKHPNGDQSVVVNGTTLEKFSRREDEYHKVLSLTYAIHYLATWCGANVSYINEEEECITV